MTLRPPYHILVLCTGNSARSVLAEALINHLGDGRFVAHSAGSRPAGRVHPLAIETLARHGFSVDGLRSKSWDEFAGEGAQPMDIVLTVCDSAASETCPVWPGAPISAHWGLPDPAAVTGEEDWRREAFARAFAIIELRVRALIDLPLDELEDDAVRARLMEIGQMLP